MDEQITYREVEKMPKGKDLGWASEDGPYPTVPHQTA